MVKLTGKTQAARMEVLRTVDRLGNNATWAQIHSHGIHYMSFSWAVLRGDLRQHSEFHYSLTDAGRAALERSEG